MHLHRTAAFPSPWQANLERVASLATSHRAVTILFADIVSL